MINPTTIHKDQREIIERSNPLGWVLEPDAKAFMKSSGFDIPGFVVTRSFETADQFLKTSQGQVVAKAVSKKILHKTEYQAVATGIASSNQLKKEMKRLLTLDGCETILVEQMITGIELILGAKIDDQFGPVVVFGIGGTSVEIYNDTAIRMAPVGPKDVVSMVESLKAKDIVLGYRGKAGAHMESLTQLIVGFSNLIMALENDIESIDFNPVICTGDKCIIADARIMLKGQKE